MPAQLTEAISPEQYLVITTGIIGVFVAIFAAVVLLIRWGAAYFTQIQDEKLNAIRQEREIEKGEAEVRRRQLEADITSRLDETQSGREMQRMFFSELAEQRKEDARNRELMQADSQRRDQQHEFAMKELTLSSQQIAVNTAATLEFLKLHAEADTKMRAEQAKLMERAETLHAHVVDISSSLDTVISKVDSLASGGTSNTRMLADIHGTLQVIQEWIKAMGIVPPANPNTDKTVKIPDMLVIEIEKEFQSQDKNP